MTDELGPAVTRRGLARFMHGPETRGAEYELAMDYALSDNVVRWGDAQDVVEPFVLRWGYSFACDVMAQWMTYIDRVAPATMRTFTGAVDPEAVFTAPDEATVGITSLMAHRDISPGLDDNESYAVTYGLARDVALFHHWLNNNLGAAFAHRQNTSQVAEELYALIERYLLVEREGADIHIGVMLTLVWYGFGGFSYVRDTTGIPLRADNSGLRLNPIARRAKAHSAFDESQAPVPVEVWSRSLMDAVDGKLPAATGARSGGVPARSGGKKQKKRGKR